MVIRILLHEVTLFSHIKNSHHINTRNDFSFINNYLALYNMHAFDIRMYRYIQCLVLYRVLPMEDIR